MSQKRQRKINKVEEKRRRYENRRREMLRSALESVGLLKAYILPAAG